MKTTTERKGLSKSLKRFFGVGDFGFTLMTNIDTYYSSYFFTNIAKFSLSVVTIITTISAVVDAILSMMYGPFLNKMKPKKWGRYRSWLVLTPWLAPFLYAMQFISIGNGLAAVVIITLAMITSRIAWNIPYIANLAMINIAGKNPEERMALSSTRSVYTTLSSVVYSYAGPAVVSLFAAIIGENNAYAATAFAFAALMAAGFYAHFKMFEGYELSGEEEIALQEKLNKERGAGETAPKVKSLDVIKTNPHLLWLMGAAVMKYVSMFLVNGLAIYYFRYVSLNENLLATFVLLASLVGVVAGYLSRFAVAKFSAKTTVVSAYALMAIVSVIGFIFYQSTMVVLVCMCLLMFMVYISNATDPELYATCAGYSGKKLGYDVTGIVMGLLTVPLKIGIVARGVLISAILALAGFNANISAAAATTELQRGISMGFMIVPAIVMVVGTLMLAFGYKLSNDKAQ